MHGFHQIFAIAILSLVFSLVFALVIVIVRPFALALVLDGCIQFDIDVLNFLLFGI